MKNLADFLKIQTDQRLLRLFAVGCCYHIWDQIKDERSSRTAVEVAERFADGQSTQKELKKARAAAYNNAYYNAPWAAASASANAAARYAACYAALDAANVEAYVSNTVYLAVHNAAIEKQLILYHCIFTKIAFTTTNPNALNLSKLIYQERQWSLMPILGDALEEDGCPEEIISHCKETEHVRGCWVVDNILRKCHARINLCRSTFGANLR